MVGILRLLGLSMAKLLFRYIVIRKVVLNTLWSLSIKVGSSIDRLVISLYAKGMSVPYIETEMHEIYGVNLYTSAISMITNKVNQSTITWWNRPLDSLYMIVWIDGIVFKVRDQGKVTNKTVYLCVGSVEKVLKRF